MKLTDSGVLSLVTFCSKLQALCVRAQTIESCVLKACTVVEIQVRSTEITDASFEAIMQSEAQMGGKEGGGTDCIGMYLRLYDA